MEIQRTIDRNCKGLVREQPVLIIGKRFREASRELPGVARDAASGFRERRSVERNDHGASVR